MNWLVLLPTLVKLLDWLFVKYNASEDTKKKVRELIESAQKDGLISLQHADSHKNHHDAILAQIEADKKKEQAP